VGICPCSSAGSARSPTPAELVSYAHATNGRMAGVTDNRGVAGIAYEAGSDRVSSVAGPVTGTVGYTYGAEAERLTMSSPGGVTWCCGHPR
jgi:hypothetical protein